MKLTYLWRAGLAVTLVNVWIWTPVKLHDTIAEIKARSEIKVSESVQKTTRTLYLEMLKINRELLIKKVTDELAMCESSGRMEVKSKLKDIHGHAYGTWQWKKPTWNEFTKKAGVPDFNIKNYSHQKYMTEWALDNMYGHLWDCCWKIEDCKNNFIKEKR